MNYDRIILEILDRVAVLEKKVEELQENEQGLTDKKNCHTSRNETSYGCKDTTKYMMDGKRYGKNRLALAIVQKYVSSRPGISAADLIRAFDRSIQGPMGVVREYGDAKNSYADSERRFFMKPTEIIHTSTVDCVVCTQWGAFNIDFLIARAQEFGFIITRV